MSVLVYAEDRSGRQDHGYYSKAKFSSALDLFLAHPEESIFFDADCETVMARSEAESIFETEGAVVFFNADGEKVVITLDRAARQG